MADARFATEKYYKLLFIRTLGPFSISAVRQHILTIDEDRIPTKIPIYLVTSGSNHANPLLRTSDSRKSENNTINDANNPTVQSMNAHYPGDTTNIQTSSETKQQSQHIQIH